MDWRAAWSWPRDCCTGPELLILDEPSVGLDPGARHDLWLYLQTLREKEGVTILVTTHLIDEGDRSDRVLVLNQGKVVALDTPGSAEGTDRRRRDFDCDERAGTSDRTTSRRKFGVTPPSFNGTLRIEKQARPCVHQPGRGRFPDMIDAVNLSKPTLEDVFIARTGHRFWEDHEADRSSSALRSCGGAKWFVSSGSAAGSSARLASPLIFWLLLGFGVGNSFSPAGQSAQRWDTRNTSFPARSC